MFERKRTIKKKIFNLKLVEIKRKSKSLKTQRIFKKQKSKNKKERKNKKGKNPQIFYLNKNCEKIFSKLKLKNQNTKKKKNTIKNYFSSGLEKIKKKKRAKLLMKNLFKKNKFMNDELISYEEVRLNNESSKISKFLNSENSFSQKVNTDYSFLNLIKKNIHLKICDENLNQCMLYSKIEKLNFEKKIKKNEKKKNKLERENLKKVNNKKFEKIFINERKIMERKFLNENDKKNIGDEKIFENKIILKKISKQKIENENLEKINKNLQKDFEEIEIKKIKKENFNEVKILIEKLENNLNKNFQDFKKNLLLTKCKEMKDILKSEETEEIKTFRKLNN